LTFIRRDIAFLRISLRFNCMVEVVNLVLQCLDCRTHHTILADPKFLAASTSCWDGDLLRVLETSVAAIRGVQALQLEISAALARYQAVTFDLSSLAFIAIATIVLAGWTEYLGRRGRPCD